MNDKHKITPHKGGRTDRLSARISPDEKKRIQARLEASGEGLADWIMRHVRDEEVFAEDEQ